MSANTVINMEEEQSVSEVENQLQIHQHTSQSVETDSQEMFMNNQEQTSQQNVTIESAPDPLSNVTTPEESDQLLYESNKDSWSNPSNVWRKMKKPLLISLAMIVMLCIFKTIYYFV